jgi:hypothetical protein
LWFTYWWFTGSAERCRPFHSSTTATGYCGRICSFLTTPHSPLILPLVVRLGLGDLYTFPSRTDSRFTRFIPAPVLFSSSGCLRWVRWVLDTAPATTPHWYAARSPAGWTFLYTFSDLRAFPHCLLLPSPLSPSVHYRFRA